jgi:hypothetical protein
MSDEPLFLNDDDLEWQWCEECGTHEHRTRDHDAIAAWEGAHDIREDYFHD